MNTQTHDMNPGQHTSRTRRVRRERHEASRWRSQSPEDVKERVSVTVAKGVAVITGAVEGVANELAKTDLPGIAAEVVRTAGETAREVSLTAKREVLATRRALAEEDGSLGEGGGDSGSSLSDSNSSGRRLSSGPKESF